MPYFLESVNTFSPPPWTFHFFSFYFNMFFPISYFPDIFVFYKSPFLCYILSISLSLKYSMYFFHKHLLKIQNRGKECAFPRLFIFLNLQVSSQFLCTFVVGITKPSKPRVAFYKYRLNSDAVSWKTYCSTCRFHR